MNFEAKICFLTYLIKYFINCFVYNKIVLYIRIIFF